MAVTCWSYMAVRKLISLNRNASNFPWAIILCPQQNKRVIFLKMRELKSLIKAVVNVVLLIAETAVFTNISPVCSVCMCVSGEYVGVRKGERKAAKPSFWKDWSCFKKFCKSTDSSWTRLFSQGKLRTLLVAVSQASPFKKWLYLKPYFSITCF